MSLFPQLCSINREGELLSKRSLRTDGQGLEVDLRWWLWPMCLQDVMNGKRRTQNPAGTQTQGHGHGERWMSQSLVAAEHVSGCRLWDNTAKDVSCGQPDTSLQSR